MKLACLYISIMCLLVGCNQSATNTTFNNNNKEDSLYISNQFAQCLKNQDSTDFYITNCRKIVEANNTVENQALFLFLLGKNFLMKGDLTKVDSIAKVGLKMPFDKTNINYKGKFYNLQGNVLGLKKQSFPSIESYINAEKVYEQTNNLESLAGIYSNIANGYFSLKDYTTALQYANKAYNLLDKVTETPIVTNIMTTYAIALIRNKNIPLALSIEKRVDSIANATNNMMAQLTSSIGFAEIYKSKMMYDSAQYYYEKCITKSKQIHQKHYELMSKMGMLTLYEETNQYNAIVANSDSILHLANELQNQDVLHTAKRVLGKAYAKQNNFEKAFLYLNQSYNQYDSAAGIENQKNINELMLKFETAKKEKEIANQNYLLANQKSKLQTRLMWILILGFILTALFSYYLYYKKLMNEKNKSLILENEKSVNKAYIDGENLERKRLALEIHDGISSTLTGINYKLKSDNFDKNEIINLVTNLHDEARMMSHKINPIDFETTSFENAIENLCSKMTSQKVDILFSNKNIQLKQTIEQKFILYRIVQEILNNALKHSDCKTIFVRLISENNKNGIEIEDDGIGIESDKIKIIENKFNERLDLLNGELTITSILNEGSTFKIELSSNE